MDQFSPADLATMALAMDFFICNYEHGTVDVQRIEDLLAYLDIMADEALEASDRVVERVDNLVVVDFQPKNG